MLSTQAVPGGMPSCFAGGNKSRAGDSKDVLKFRAA